jgi:hypothetical protein
MIRDVTGGRVSVLGKVVTEINSGRPLEGKWYIFQLFWVFNLFS